MLLIPLWQTAGGIVQGQHRFGVDKFSPLCQRESRVTAVFRFADSWSSAARTRIEVTVFLQSFAPINAELLTASSPPIEQIFPTSFTLLTSFHGTGVLNVHELTRMISDSMRSRFIPVERQLWNAHNYTSSGKNHRQIHKVNLVRFLLAKGLRRRFRNEDTGC